MLKSITQTRAFSSSAARNAFAKMQLLGNVGSVTPKETKDGLPFITYSLAVNRYDPRNAEEGKNTVTDWYNLSVFDDKQVQFFQTHIRKGAQVYAEAVVSQRAYTDANGDKQILTSLRQTDFDVVRFPKKETEEAEADA